MISEDEVRRAYAGIGRTNVDKEGLDYWMGQDKDAFSKAFSSSAADPTARSNAARMDEGFADKARDDVQRNYSDLFGRVGENAGADYWVNSGLTGTALTDAMKGAATGMVGEALRDNSLSGNQSVSNYTVGRDGSTYGFDNTGRPVKLQSPLQQVGNPGGNFTGTGDNNGGTITNLHTAVPDHTGVQYGPGVATGSPSLGDPSGWGWNPSENLWMGSRTGTVNGPVPYKTTDSGGNVIRSWGLAAHPWDAPAPMNQGAGIPNAQGTAPAFGSSTHSIGGGFSLPNWTGQQQQTPQLAEGGSVRGAVEQLLRGK